MANCVVLACQPPAVTTSSQYTVRAGDTLTAIARRFGFASWRDIYYHPDNETFRKKRPNPDKIFPGDVLAIPGRPGDHSLLPRAGSTFMSYFPPLKPFQPEGNQFQPEGSQFQSGVKSKNDQFAIDYVHPGNVKIRLTLFWVTNCLNLDSVSGVLLAKAEELFAQHGLGLDVYPSRHRTKEHTIKTPENVVASGDLLLNYPPHNHYNEIRLEGARRFDDQKTSGKKQRLPVFFCEFKDIANGVTVIGSPWPAYVLVSGKILPDRATLAHEIIHATGFLPHIPRPKNLMAEITGSRHEIFRMHVEMLAKAYFSR
jgi:hypothetical protein